MNLTVNGKQHTAPEGATIADVMLQLQAPQHGVAVAVDGRVVPRSAWDSALIANARIEVLKAVQGG